MDKRQAFISEIKRVAVTLVVKGEITDAREIFKFLKEEFDKNEATKNHASIGYMDLLIKSGGLKTSEDLIKFINHIK